MDLDINFQVYKYRYTDRWIDRQQDRQPEKKTLYI